MGAPRRRRKQMTQGYNHLARICGGTYRGGRPIYRRRALTSVADAIARERARARAEAARKAKGK